MAINDGGSAFPGECDRVLFHGDDPTKPAQTIAYRSRGMTLRDYFAGQALAGFAGRMDSEDRRRYRTGAVAGHEAAAAYSLADAMLRARDQRPNAGDPGEVDARD